MNAYNTLPILLCFLLLSFKVTKNIRRTPGRVQNISWRILRILGYTVCWFQTHTLTIYKSPSHPSTTTCSLLWDKLSHESRAATFNLLAFRTGPLLFLTARFHSRSSDLSLQERPQVLHIELSVFQFHSCATVTQCYFFTQLLLQQSSLTHTYLLLASFQAKIYSN